MASSAGVVDCTSSSASSTETSLETTRVQASQLSTGLAQNHEKLVLWQCNITRGAEPASGRSHRPLILCRRRRPTTPFYTKNDSGDGDTGGNGLINFPVITAATLSGGNLILNGYARPGSVIEFFIADSDASGFGEGQTYITTLTEGSGADTDATTGTYSGLINGIDQGTDNTNRFSFTIATPGGVTAGTKLTATATVSNNTSEFSGNVTVTLAYNISGNVFEDLNYGGGAGRSLASSSGVGRPSALVELYYSDETFHSFVFTDSSGNYVFPLLVNDTYVVRVINITVTSSRSGYTNSCLAVQTYRTDASSGTAVAVTDRVGGEDPSKVDMPDGSGQGLAALSQPIWKISRSPRLSLPAPMSRVWTSASTSTPLSTQGTPGKDHCDSS